MQEFDKNCTIIIRTERNVWQPIAELQRNLEKSDINAKTQALEEIILGMVHGEHYSSLLIPVIRFAVPSENHRVKKLTQIFFEIVDKSNPDGTLKEEMILLCNALRNDLMSPNEYVRGSTLRLLCKMRHFKILEPLLDAILSNLSSRHSYVRKNAVMCVYSIIKNFGSGAIPRALDEVSALLQRETDLSTRRNAFLTILHSDLERAMNYAAAVEESVSNLGDIFQLVLIELVRKVCRQNVTRKAAFIRLVINLVESSPPAVAYEGASALISLSSSPIVLKAASEAYVKLLINQADNNVKLIVLDRLVEIMKKYKHAVEESIIEILRALNSQSLEIRRRTMEIVLYLVSHRSITDVIVVLKKEVLKTLELENKSLAETKEYRRLLIRSIHAICTRYPESASSIIELLMDLLVETDQRVTTEVVILVREIAANKPNLAPAVLERIVFSFNEMKQSRVLRVCLWIMGEYCTSLELVMRLIDKVYHSIIPLKPVTERTEGGNEIDRRSLSDNDGSVAYSPKTRMTTRTVVLDDGTYGTEDVMIEDLGDANGPEHTKEKGPQTALKNMIVSGDFLLCAVLAVSATKMALKNVTHADKKLSAASAALCNKVMHIVASLLRFVKLHPFGGVGNDSYIRVNHCFKAMLALLKSRDSQETMMYRTYWFPDGDSALSKVLEVELAENEASLMLKSEEMEEARFTEPDEPLMFRHLREQRSPVSNGLDSDELDVRTAVGIEETAADGEQLFQQRLQKVQQMTGFSDPVYVEAFIQVLQFDLLVEFTVINKSLEILQNVTLEIFTHGDMKLVDRPASVTLVANQSVRLYASVKVQSMDTGILFGYATYDKRGAGETEFLVLNELHVDVLEYIKKSWIGELRFRSMWSEFEWENKLSINTSITDVAAFLAHIIQHTNMTIVGRNTHQLSSAIVQKNGKFNTKKTVNESDYVESVKTILANKNLTKNSAFFAVNLYCRSIFGEDALANVSIERLSEGKLAGSVRIRSRTQGVALSLGDRITLLQRGIAATDGTIA